MDSQQTERDRAIANIRWGKTLTPAIMFGVFITAIILILVFWYDVIAESTAAKVFLSIVGLLTIVSLITTYYKWNSEITDQRIGQELEFLRRQEKLAAEQDM